VAETLGDLVVRLVADTKGFGSELLKAEKGLQDFAGRATGAGLALSAAITGPLAAVAGGSIKAASSFESAFASVRKTVNATSKQLQDLQDDFRAMAKEMPVGADALAEIGAIAGQLGIKTENIKDFTKNMALLGVTTNLSATEGAQSLARFANITNMSQAAFGNLSSTIVALGNSVVPATEQEIVNMSMRLAAAGHQVGLTQQQILGLGAALSGVGLEAEAGGSAMSRIMIDMAKSVSTGGEKLGEFARVAGMTSGEFQKAFRTDAMGAIQAFVTGLSNMKAAGGDVLQALAALGIEEIRTRDTALRLSGTATLLGTAVGVANKAWTDNNAATREAGIRFATTENQLKLLWNRITDVGITLGNSLLPTIVQLAQAAIPLVDKLGALAKWFADLPGPVRETAVVVLAVAAAIGPTVLALGLMANGLAQIIGLFGALKAGSFAAQFAGIGSAGSALGATLGTLAIQAGLAYAAFEVGLTVGSWLREAIDDYLPSLSRWLDSVGEKIIDVYDHWGDLNDAMSSGQGFDSSKMGLPGGPGGGADWSGSVGHIGGGYTTPAGQMVGPMLPPGVKVGGGGPEMLDAEQKKKLVELQGELQKLKAVHGGVYASMVAEAQASLAKHLQEAGGIKTLQAAAHALYAEQVKAAQDQVRTSTLGAGLGEKTTALNDLKVALDAARTGAGLSTQELQKAKDAVLALGTAGINSAVGMDILNEALKRSEALALAAAPIKDLGDLGMTMKGDFSRALGSQMDGSRTTPLGVRPQIMGGNVLFDTKDLGETDAEAMKHVKAMQEWRAAAGELQNTLQGLAGYLGNSWGGTIAGALANGIGAWQNYEHQAKTTAEKVQAAAAAGAAALDIMSSSKEERNGGKRAVSGAAKGAQAGAAFGVYGIVIGAVAGALIGFFSGPAWAGTAKVAGQVFGFQVSNELAKAIHNTKFKFGVDAQTASLLNIDKALGESGKSAHEMSGPIFKLLDGIRDKSIPAKAGLEQMNKLFGQVADEAARAGTVGDKMLVTMIATARAAGDMSQEMQSFVKGKLADAMAGIGGMTGSVDEKTGKVTGGISLTAGTGEGAMAGFSPQTVEDNAAAQGTIFSAVFWANVKESGLLDSVDAMAEPFAALQQKMEEALGPEAAARILGPMADVFNSFKDNEGARGALQGVDALSGALKGLADTGYLTKNSFAAIQQQGVASFQQLVASGVPVATALQAMAPMIQQAISAAEQYGIPLSADMQHMKELAEANGIAFKTDPMLKMVEILEKIAIKLGAIGTPRRKPAGNWARCQCRAARAPPSPCRSRSTPPGASDRG
jgi:TP901 family phage tail tape measure protein